MNKSTSYIKKESTNKQGIQLMKIAAFCFTIVSCITTATGLGNFVFKDSQAWQAGIISFSIQTILFILNLKLPGYFAKIKNNIKNNVEKKVVCVLFVIFFITVLLSSSIFSFVYICDASYLSRNISYIDANMVLTNKYNEVLELTSKYIDENIKATAIIACNQLSDLPLPKTTTEEVSINELEEARDLAKSNYEACEEKKQLLQKKNDILVNEVNTLSKQIFVYERNGSTKYDDAKKEMEDVIEQLSKAEDETRIAKEKYDKAVREYKNYTPSKEIITQEFLSELLKREPNADILDKDMNELTNMILELGNNENIVSEYEALVQKTKELNITIDKYKLLKLSAKNYANGEFNLLNNEILFENSINLIESDITTWKNNWQLNYESLKKLVESTPPYIKSNSLYITDKSIDIDLLESYKPLDLYDELSKIERLYLSDINKVERAFNSFFSKYTFNIWFSAAFALFLDLTAFMVGLFIYYHDEKKTISEKSKESFD